MKMKLLFINCLGLNEKVKNTFEHGQCVLKNKFSFYMTL